MSEANIDLTLGDLKNPKKAGRKFLRILETGVGGVVGGLADGALSGFLKNGAIRSAVGTLGSALGAGALKQKDLKAIMRGMTAVFSRDLVMSLKDYIMSLAKGRKGVSTSTVTANANTTEEYKGYI